MKKTVLYMQRSALNHKKQILNHNLEILNRKKKKREREILKCNRVPGTIVTCFLYFMLQSKISVTITNNHQEPRFEVLKEV